MKMLLCNCPIMQIKHESIMLLCVFRIYKMLALQLALESQKSQHLY